MELSIVPLSEITPHEKTIPSFLKLIKDDMRRTGYQRDPILVAKRTHFAMDGMHRLKCLKTLGAKFALCAEYDYNDSSIKVERWLRTMIAPSRNVVAGIVSTFRMVPCPKLEAAVDLVESGSARIALLSRRESFVSNWDWSNEQLYQKISLIDLLCGKSGVALDFQPDSAKLALFSSESVMTLLPEKLSKKDIVKITKKQLLPYKSTRYIVPVRPMGVFFPISLLKRSSLQDCKKKLREIVKLSKVTFEKRNAWYEGRRYSEQIAVFRKAE